MKILRQANREKQSNQYFVHNHFHGFNVLLWTELFGLIIRLDMKMYGSEIDGGLHNRCKPYKYPRNLFGNKQVAIADSSF